MAANSDTAAFNDQMLQLQADLNRYMKEGNAAMVANTQREITHAQTNRPYQMSWQGGAAIAPGSVPGPTTPEAGGGRGRINPPRTDDPVDPATRYSSTNLVKIISEQSQVNEDATVAQQTALGKARDFSYQAAIQSADQAQQVGSVYQQIQKSGGLIAEDPNNLHAQLSQALFANDTAYSAEREKYDQLKSVSLLDDPLGYVMAQLQLPSQGAKVNALAGKDEQLQSIFQRTIQMDADAKREMTANTVASARNIALSQAEADKSKADAQIAALTGQAAVNKMQVSATAAAAIDRATDDPLKTARQREQLAALEDARTQRELQAAQSMRSANLLGLAAPMAEKDINNLPPALKQDWEKLNQTGVASPELMVELGKGLIGTPREAEYNAALLVTKGIQAEVDAVMKLPANAGRMSLKEAQQIGRDSYYTAMYNSLRDPKMGVPGMLDKSWDSKGNIYRPNLASFVQDQTMRAGQGLPTSVTPTNGLMRLMVQTLKTPGAVGANGNITIANEKQTIQAFAELQAQGKLMGTNGKPMTAAEAASQIAEFYKASTSYATQLNKPAQLGLTPITNYRGELTTPYTDRAAKTDLLSKTELENWLVTYAKERKLLHAPFRGTGFGIYN
jgi:hypothetical protein